MSDLRLLEAERQDHVTGGGKLAHIGILDGGGLTVILAAPGSAMAG